MESRCQGAANLVEPDQGRILAFVACMDYITHPTMEDRRLAAIMFTDIVGYTALMGSDEKKAFEVLRKNRNIQKPIIARFSPLPCSI